MVQHYQDDLVRGLLKNLSLYGTGRKPDVAALTEIGTIQNRLRAWAIRSAMVKAVVCSDAFLGTQ